MTWIVMLMLAATALGPPDAVAQIKGEGIGVVVVAPPGPPPPTVTGLCAIRITGTPPDASGGWAMQVRNGNANVGSSDASVPYSRDATLKPGAWLISLRWSKAGQATVATAAVSGVCP